MIPKEDEGEHFEDALARVRRCVGGGAATENADSDSDIEVVADCIPVNLRCPVSSLDICILQLLGVVENIQKKINSHFGANKKKMKRY